MKFLKDKEFLKGMLAIAVPVSLQNLISSSLNMIDIDVSDLEPQVACPHHVDNVKAVGEVDVEIDQVFV